MLVLLIYTNIKTWSNRCPKRSQWTYITLPGFGIMPYRTWTILLVCLIGFSYCANFYDSGTSILSIDQFKIIHVNLMKSFLFQLEYVTQLIPNVALDMIIIKPAAIQCMFSRNISILLASCHLPFSFGSSYILWSLNH